MGEYKGNVSLNPAQAVCGVVQNYKGDTSSVAFFVFFTEGSSMLTSKKIILASSSPRRKQLLRQLGLEYEIRENTIEEVFDPAKSPEENVLSLSALKAKIVANSVDDGIVVGADTIVVLDGQILGKPKDTAEAEAMLTLLSGREHRVYTGFTIIEKPSGKSASDVEVTKVRFRELDGEEIKQYVRSGSPLDKAGAYGIQDDFGAVFVEKIEGCFYNVVGFPLAKFYLSLKRFLSD